MKWIGLTGGIATGKSKVEQLIKSLGIPVIDADQLAHQVVQSDQPGLQLVVTQFGTEYLNPNGELDRRKLGQLVFKDTVAREILEKILHPLVQAEVQKLKTEYDIKGYQNCVYSVPLLFEKNLEKQFDTIVTVWCDPQIQLERLMKRNELSSEEALLRIKAQLPFWKKIKNSDFCIDNSTNLQDLEVQVKSFVEHNM